MLRCLVIWVVLWTGGVHLPACTVFVLTDTNRVLFCNNEDGAKTRTRVWFVPGDPTHYGCVLLGYDDGVVQGGMNTEGLAFDWLAGWREAWKPDPGLPKIRSGRAVLEKCGTVEEAIAFYREHDAPGFTYAKIFLADKSGASALIGAHQGQLQINRSHTSWGLGYGGATLQRMLGESCEPTLPNGERILRACLQPGTYATRYFNIFDVKSGDIFLFPFPHRNDEVNLNLAVELSKGRHYYDMANTAEQLQQTPRRLRANMKGALWERSAWISSPKDWRNGR